MSWKTLAKVNRSIDAEIKREEAIVLQQMVAAAVDGCNRHPWVSQIAFLEFWTLHGGPAGIAIDVVRYGLRRMRLVLGHCHGSPMASRPQYTR